MSEDLNNTIDNFIIEIFKRASVNIDGVHWNTIRAKISRMGNQKKLGAWTSYRYQWNQRFHEAFAFVVAKFGAKLARRFCNSKDAIESALKNVEDSFLGTADNLYKIDIPNKYVSGCREKYPSAKEPLGLHNIIFVYSRHVEVITLLQKA